MLYFYIFLYCCCINFLPNEFYSCRFVENCIPVICFFLKEHLVMWAEYEVVKNQLELFVAEVRLKLRDADEHRELLTNAAESVQRDSLSACELLTAVEFRRIDLERLQQISDVLTDTASEARQTALRSEIAALTDAVVEITEMLMQRITWLEVLDQRWTELSAQSSDLKTLLPEKQETLHQTIHDTSLTPDQQYAIVKVRVILFW